MRVPMVYWFHQDGPLLVCSTHKVHWLTVLERIALAFRLTTINKLDKKHRQL